MDNNENAVSSELVTSFDRFLRDGVKKSNYQRWHKRKAPFAVPANTWVLTRNIFNKSEDAIELIDGGLIMPVPFFREYLFVPQNSTTIDYSTETNNFKFQTDIANNGYDVQIDPVLKVRIVDPIKYLYRSNNALADLQDLVSTVLREFAAMHTAQELIKSNFKLEEIDINGHFEEFRRQSGLKIENLRIKNIELPKEVKEARTQEEQAKSRITQAKYREQEAEIDARSKLKYSENFVQFARQNKDIEEDVLLELVRLAQIQSAPKDSHIIIGGSNLNNRYYPAWMMNDSNQRQLSNNSQEQITIDMEDTSKELQPYQAKSKRRKL